MSNMMKEENLFLRNVGGVSIFSEKRVTTDDIQEIMASLSYTPSNANAQPWEVIVSESLDDKKRILQTLLDSQFRKLKMQTDSNIHWLLTAPLLFIISLDKMRAKAKYGGAEAERYGWIDLGSACQNLLITAASLGVKGTIIREFDRNAVAEHFELPPYIDPSLILCMGYSEVKPLSRPSLTVDDYVHYQSWSGKLSERE